MKSNGTSTPGPSDCPTRGISNYLAFQKKAMSHFMPFCTMQWDGTHLQGNPTCSTTVNSIIVKVKNGLDKMYLQPALQSTGVCGNLLACACLSLVSDSDICFFLTAVFCLQRQISGCIDDSMKLIKSILLCNTCKPSTFIKSIGQQTSGRSKSCHHRFCLGKWIPLSVIFSTLQLG